MKGLVRTGAAAAALLAFTTVGSGAPADGPAALRQIEVARFSLAEPASPLPPQWEPQVFKKIQRHTEYRLVLDQGRTVLRADSRAGASGLVRKLAVDPSRTPMLRWRWKVSGVLAKGDVARKSGDDYPARIYVTFAYDPGRVGFLEKAKYEAAKLIYGAYPPAGALAYIWANRAPVGGFFDNPYTDRVKMIAVRSGAARAGQWVSQQRNIVEDYRAAFGESPPPVSGIAVMTDTDNTGESATAWYGDITLSAE